MSKTLRRRGYKVTGCARQFSLQDFGIFDLILVMDDENHRNILKLADTEEKRAKLQNFTNFCLHHHHHEVPDPYYGGDAGFQLVTDLIEDGSKVSSNTLRRNSILLSDASALHGSGYQVLPILASTLRPL